MLKSIEMTGKTEDAAIAAALETLGMDRDDVSVEILERPKTGFLGIGSAPARVRVSFEAPDEPEQPEPLREEAPEAPAAPTAVEEAPAAPEPVEKIPAVGEKADQIAAFLTGLMEHLDNDAKPVITQGPEGSFDVELVGSDLGALIGRRGETLDAIQQLTIYAVNRGQSKRVRIHLDAENYRAKREETLKRLAQKTAGKAIKYRRNMMLEPMNAYERHVIHTALQDYEGVTTYSTGTEPNRRIVIAYER